MEVRNSSLCVCGFLNVVQLSHPKKEYLSLKFSSQPFFQLHQNPTAPYVAEMSHNYNTWLSNWKATVDPEDYFKFCSRKVRLPYGSCISWSLCFMISEGLLREEDLF